MRQLLIVLALVATGVGASPSNSYLDVSGFALGYDQSGAAPDDDAVGLRFRSSVSFDDEWFWPFELALVDYSAERGHLWKTGIGYAFPLDAMDIVVKAEVGRMDFGTISGGGFSWDVQFRSVNWDSLELNAHLGQGNVDPVDTFVRYGIGMAWTPFDSMGFVVEYDQYTGGQVDLDAVAIGVRWDF